MVRRQIIPAIFILVLVLALGWYVDFLVREEITGALRLAIKSVAYTTLVLSIIAGLFAFLWIREEFYTRRAKRRQAEREADVYAIVSENHGVFVREMNTKAIWRPLHLNVATHQNGKASEPTVTEMAVYQFYHQRNSERVIGAGQPAPLQLSQPLPEYVNLADHIAGSLSLDSLFLGIGKYPDGRVEPVRRALTSLVHICAGGASGFGKSVFMQSLAYQALIAREVAEFTFLDAQAVTFQVFSDSDRLRYPVVSDEQDVRRILADLGGEIKRRKELFSHWRGVFSLSQYNNAADEPLPWLPIFYDEFGLHAKDKQIASLVDGIAKGGRKFGIYLLASSQTWYSSDIASSLKANLSSAFQFYVPGKSQSRVLLEDSRAVELSRQGQCYARLPGQAGLIEMQAPDCSTLLDITPVMIEATDWRVPEPVEDEPESADDMFVRMVEDEGMSRSEASRLAFGKDYAGTSHVQKCKRLLGEI